VAYYDCEAVFQSKTNLPKDRFVNTFHFVGGTGAASAANSTEMLACASRIANFYSKPYSYGGGSAYLSDWLSQEIEPLVTVNVYDHAEGLDLPKGQRPPRRPFPFHFTLPAAGRFALALSGNLPEEVALCLSYFSTRNSPRERGRLYLGPFNLAAVGTPATITSRPDPNLIATMVAAATDLATVEDGVIDISNALVDGLFIAGLFGLPGAPKQPSFLDPALSFPPASPVNWVQHSVVGTGTMPTKKNPQLPNAPAETFELVGGGWVDNEWDSQRRRRIESSARTNFIAV
jgi:hypothetical protein